MQVVTERLPNAVAKISVTVDQTEVTQAMDRAFKRVVAKYNVPGFRRGKVPRPIFERMVGVGVIWEAAAKELVDVRYPIALKMAGVEPLAQPQIDIESQGIEPDEPFRFVIAVETKPEIDLGDYHDLLTSELIIPEVTPERLEEEMVQVARSQAQLVPADDEPVASGNQVVLALKGYLEEPDEDDEDLGLFAEDDDYTVQVGSGTTVEGLEDQLIGLKVGEPATIHLTYPAEHPDVDLRGKPVRFEVTVTQNKRLDIPSIDDELAKALEFDSLEALRAEVAARLADQLEAQAKDERLQQILGKLKERVSFDLPEKLVEEAVSQRVAEVQNSLARMEITFDQYLESRQIDRSELEAELRPQAEMVVRDRLILETVAQREGLSVTDEEMVVPIRQLAQIYRQTLENMAQLLHQQGDFEKMRSELLAHKAGEFLASTVYSIDEVYAKEDERGYDQQLPDPDGSGADQPG